MIRSAIGAGTGAEPDGSFTRASVSGCSDADRGEGVPPRAVGVRSPFVRAAVTEHAQGQSGAIGHIHCHKGRSRVNLEPSPQQPSDRNVVTIRSVVTRKTRHAEHEDAESHPCPFGHRTAPPGRQTPKVRSSSPGTLLWAPPCMSHVSLRWRGDASPLTPPSQLWSVWGGRWAETDVAAEGPLAHKALCPLVVTQPSQLGGSTAASTGV